MSDSPRKRYIRLVRHSTLQQKAGFFVLLLATAALAYSFTSARDRLAKPSLPGPVAGADGSGLGEE